MESLKCELKKHRTTRKILSVLARPHKQESNVQEGSVHALRRLTEAVSRYGVAMETAFEALLAALEGLEHAGLREVVSIAPLAEGFAKGLYESHSIVKNVVRSMSVPLEAHSAAIATCLADVARAEHLSSELRRYEVKVGALAEESEQKGELKKEQSEVRLQRNRGKLQSAERDASEAEAKAESSLKACLARRASVEEIAHGAIVGTVEALRAAVGHIPGGQSAASASSSRPSSPQFADTGRRRGAAAETNAPPPPPPPAPPLGSLNPFESDIADDGPAQDQRSPRSLAGNAEGQPAQKQSDPGGEGNDVDLGWNPFEEDVEEAPIEPSLVAASSPLSFQTSSTAEAWKAGSPQGSTEEARR